VAEFCTSLHGPAVALSSELLKKGDVIVSARALTDPEHTAIVRVFEAHDGDLSRADTA